MRLPFLYNENPRIVRGYPKAYSYESIRPTLCKNGRGLPTASMTKGERRMDKNSLSHTTWNCKYHIVFAPKYRRQIIYGKIKAEIGKILRTLCDRKGVEIIEVEACP